MSLKRLLIHRCTLTSPAQQVGEDDYGRPIYDSTPIENVPCRADQIRVQRQRGDTGTDYVWENLLFFHRDTPITDDSTISNIQDLEGNPVLQGSFFVQEIAPKYRRRTLSHYEVTLREE